MLKRAEGFSGRECTLLMRRVCSLQEQCGGAWAGATWIRELVALNGHDGQAFDG